MHLPTLLLTLAALTLTTATHDKTPCGFKIAPCPPGNICRANDPACTRGENCLGTCVGERSPPVTETPPPPTFTTSTRAPPPSTTTKTRAPPRPTYQPCGGFRVDPARTCGEGYACVDNPFVSGCGMACDWPGICVKVKGAPFCAGFVGKMCPDNMYCIDFPDDGCSVDEGGADCMGLCI